MNRAKKIKEIKDSELKWVGLDLDGTIAENSGYPDFNLLKPMSGAENALKELTKRGYKIAIFTARPYSDYAKIENWLTSWNMPFRRIFCGKVLCHRYHDDRNVGFSAGEKGWAKLLEECPPQNFFPARRKKHFSVKRKKN